jgi:hypothetical protein
MSRLDVLSGEKYTVSSGESEDYSGADVKGELTVDGELNLSEGGSGDLENSESPLTLPLSPLKPTSMQTGMAIFIIGALAVFLGAAAFLRNYAAGVAWGFSVIVLLLSALFGIGLELFWSGLVLTAILIVAGMVIRWDM